MTETIHQAYCDCLKQLSRQPRSPKTGLHFFDQRFTLHLDRIVDAFGEKPTDAVGLVLCRYLLNRPAKPLPPGQQVTFRELKGAGPLVANFLQNTNKIIASAFANDVATLTQRTLALGGTPEQERGGYDLYMRFEALPSLPIWLQFNGADGLFAAQATLLFNQSAEHYLDMQSLFIVATYLTGRLVAR